MTRLLLVRHALTDAVGNKLTGRLPGFPLNAEGRAQAEALAEMLARIHIDAIHSSPLERAFETAVAIANRHELPVTTSEGLHEFDLGEWSGKSFLELQGDELWSRFNMYRSVTRPPAGETMVEAQARMVRELERLSVAYPGQTVIAVSHADPLRAALAYHLGVPLDLAQRIELAPASVSVLVLASYGAKVELLNGKVAPLHL